MPFVNDTVVVRSCGPERWELAEPVSYLGAREGFIVPANFRTDFATVPKVFTWLVPRYGIYTRAAVLHDYLCIEAKLGRFSRADADGIFRRVLRELGVSLPRRWLMWAAVRAGGRMTGASPVAWLQFLVVALLAVFALLIPVLVVQFWLWLFNLVEWISDAAGALSTEPLGHDGEDREVNPGPG